MKTIAVLALFIISLSAGGCCSNEPRVEPAYPQSVSGWKERSKHGVRIHGEFVLNKGTSTDNGKIQVKIIDLIPPEPCAEAAAFQANARARIQFVRLSDNKVLLNDLFVDSGWMTLRTADGSTLYDEFGVDVIYVYDINLEDGWVHFELRG
jgi:hypothetical protein